MSVRDATVRSEHDRTLSVQEGGDRTGRAVLVHTGTPGSRCLYRPHLRDAESKGIRLISYDRPGYGGSTSDPGRVIADCASDAQSIADALEIERFAVWGISGGGPHALACAALLPDRVVAAATLASPAPFDAIGLDWFDGQGPENLEDAQLMLSDPAAARTKLAGEREVLLSGSARDLLELYPTLVSKVDAAVLAGGLAEYYATRDKDSLAPGIEGWWEDSQATLKPWGFESSEIDLPVLIWHGRQDRFVPLAHGEWLAAHIPRASGRFTDRDGHLTLWHERVPMVHSWLLEHF